VSHLVRLGVVDEVGDVTDGGEAEADDDRVLAR
jgi:hypothetical protein